MVFLKSIFSLYIGVFLILPGCLCQILAPFGIQVLHAPPDGSVDPSRSGPPVATITLPIDCSGPVDCNCDDVTLKTAEQCAVSSVFYQQDIYKIAATCPWADVHALSFNHPRHTDQLVSRAPPDFQAYPFKRPLQTLLGVMLV